MTDEHVHEDCADSSCENHYAEMVTAETEVELEPKPTETGKNAAEQALAAIRQRSFSGRHPELGKMIKCQVCSRRHRESIKHEQKFATGRYDLRDPKPLLIAGQTPETETVVVAQKIRLEVGAAPFKGKRRHPPLNKRENQYVELVRQFLPDEYTEDDMRKARTRARFILAERHGRYRILQKKEKNEQLETTPSVQTA